MLTVTGDKIPLRFFIRIRFIFCALLLFGNLPLNIIAQVPPVILSKEQAEEDFRWLRFALEYVHPRIYKYEDKAIVDARFDSLSSRINTSIRGLDFLSLVSKTNAAVRCGHLYTIPQEHLSKEILDKKLLPFHVKIIDEKIYVINSCAEQTIPNGAQILSINRRSYREILQAILAGVATDGNIQTRKYRLMERYFYRLFHGFDLYYHLHVDRSDRFSIEFLPLGSSLRKTALVNGLTFSERTKLIRQKYRLDEQAWFKTPSPVFRLFEQQSYAILKLPRSFYDKKIDPDFDSLLRSAFRAIKLKNIQNLILDLRNNEGGSEYQQMQLMSYLYDQPFKLYQNIYISRLDFRPLKPVIIERDTAKLLFNNNDNYMRQINENLWINNYEYDENLRLHDPKADVFTGRLFVLMNGTCFSSAADLVADLKKTGRGVFIGEETGGDFEGPSGGTAIVIQLPNSKIMVRISPNIQVGYKYQDHPLGRGVFPDYPVTYTIEDILAGRDLEMELARSMIFNEK